MSTRELSSLKPGDTAVLLDGTLRSTVSIQKVGRKYIYTTRGRRFGLRTGNDEDFGHARLCTIEGFAYELRAAQVRTSLSRHGIEVWRANLSPELLVALAHLLRRELPSIEIPDLKSPEELSKEFVRA